MTISFNRYVNITSGVGGSSLVAGRSLTGRIFSANNLIPPQKIALVFSNSADVGTYFGTTSEEYLRAQFYFGWISKNTTAPPIISFSRWVNTSVAPMIHGNIQGQLLATWNAISNGSIIINATSSSVILTALDFTAAGSLSAVAGIIQAAVRTYGADAQFTTATVSWNSTRGSFDFVGGSAEVSVLTVENNGSGTAIAPILGWLSGSTLVICNGSLVETITQTLTTSASLSNNFGSFLFLTNLSLDLAQITEAATWNNTDPQNITYMYAVPVIAGNVSNYYTALSGLGGTAVTLAPITTEYPEMAPMMIMAATDYLGVNSVQNYMFQQFGLTPSVTDNTTANTMDANRINYYGQTQQAGQLLSFYQTGVLMGIATQPRYQNIYANEQWLKDAAGAAIMNLLLGLPILAANAQGKAQIITTLQGIVNQALLNGTISVGKPLSSLQQLYITELTNDPKAWYQVQNSGYWLNVVLVQVQVGPNLVWQANYTLVYSKDDSILKVNGSHTLI